MEENLELNVFDNEFVRLGGFWERFAAYFIDGIILSIVFIPLNWIPVLGPILMLFFAFAYYIYFYTTTGQTPGKKILGLKVLDTDGDILTFGKAFLREIGFLISALILNIGFLMIGFTKRKQGLHDKIAGTVVIAKEKKHTILGVILFLVSFILPIILAVTIIIPNLIRAKNIATQKATQTSSQMPSEKYSPFPKTKEKEESAKETVLQAITEIEEKVAKVSSYQLDFKSTVAYPDGTKIEKEGYEIRIFPNKIKTDITTKIASETKQEITISDGKHLWSADPAKKLVYDISLEKLEKLIPGTKEKFLATMPHIGIIVPRELREAVINGSGRLKGIDNLDGEKIYIFEQDREEAVQNLPPFFDKTLAYIGANDGLSKMNIVYDKQEREVMTILKNFSRINQISGDEFNLPSDWQVVDITDKFKQ